MNTSRNVTFAASEELIEALDLDAYDNEVTRAARIRTILAAYLKSTGAMEQTAPTTYQLGQNNSNFAVSEPIR